MGHRKSVRGKLRRVTIALAVVLGLLVPGLFSQSAQASSCAYNFYGYVGYYICGTHTQHYSNTAGGEREFVIGTDHAIWNIIKYNSNGSISGWRSLGGWGKTGVYDDVRLGVPLEIKTVGADGLWWCDAYINGSWQGWYKNQGCP